MEIHNQKFVNWSKKLNVSLKKQTEWNTKRVLKILKTLFFVSMLVVFVWGLIASFFGVWERTIFINGIEIDHSEFDLTEYIESKDVLRKKEEEIIYIEKWWDLYDKAETTSPLHLFFVYPISWFYSKTCYVFGWKLENNTNGGNIGAAIGALFFLSLLMNTLNSYGAWGMQKNQSKMNKIKSKVSEIKNKYKDNKDAQSRKMQQSEISKLYRKNNINPANQALSGFVFAPLLLVMFLIARSHILIVGTKLDSGNSDFDFSFVGGIYSKLKNLNFNWRYYLMIFSYFVLFGIKFLVPWLMKKKEKIIVATTTAATGGSKGKIIKYAMQGMFVFFFFIVPVGTALHLTFGLFFQTSQKVLFAYLQKKNKEIKTLRKRGIETSLWKHIFFTKKTK